jgi:UDP-N-acetylmuramoylalanine-D-glutamate ligase
MKLDFRVSCEQVEILTAIKDFKKGIYEAQWQVAKLGMDEEDLVEAIKQFQLLRVTKQLQTVIKNGEDISTANEVAALENRCASHSRYKSFLVVFASSFRSARRQSTKPQAGTGEWGGNLNRT